MMSSFVHSMTHLSAEGEKVSLCFSSVQHKQDLVTSQGWKPNAAYSAVMFRPETSSKDTLHMSSCEVGDVLCSADDEL